MRLRLYLFAIVLLSVACLAATWGKFNNITVGSSGGNVGKYNNVTIGTTTGNIGAFNTLTSPGGGGGSTWALVHPIVAQFCSSTATCAATITSTGANHVLAFGISIYGPSGSDISVSSVTCTGTACTGGNAFVKPAGCVSYDTTSLTGVTCGYMLGTGTSNGITQISVTVANSYTAGVLFVGEYSWSGTTRALDGGATPINTLLTASCGTNCNGPALTITGTRDFIFAWSTCYNNCTSVSPPFSDFTEDSSTGFAAADNLNTSSGAASVWQGNSGSAMYGGAIAFSGT